MIKTAAQPHTVAVSCLDAVCVRSGYGFLMLGQGLLHAPSQHCYDQFERIWKMYWFDLNTHWFPGASAFSGPSSRHYDMITGVHGRADKWSNNNTTEGRREGKREGLGHEWPDPGSAISPLLSVCAVCQGCAGVPASAVPAVVRGGGASSFR